MITAIAVIFSLSILILIHELGHFFMAKKFGIFVEEFGIGMPPRIYGKKKGETVYSVNALPIGGFVKIAGENREEDGSAGLPPDRIFYNLKIWKRILILLGGVVMNFLLGWVLVSVIFYFGIPQAVIITDVQADSPAGQAGIMANDRVLGFNTVDEFIGFVGQHKGEKITVKVDRFGEERDFELIPRQNPPQDEGPLGVALVDAGQEKMGFFNSVTEGLKSSARIFAAVFTGIFNLIKTAVLGKASLEGIAGPVGIVKVTAQATQMGIIYLLQIVALISINLAALNVFPFPALDGGRILFLLVEKIKGSPLPKKFEQYANAVGFALLIILMLIITFKDVFRLFKPV